MSATFECNYATLRKVGGDFIQAMKTANLEELDAGLNCWNLHFIGFIPEYPHEEAGSAALMRIVMRLYILREMELGS